MPETAARLAPSAAPSTPTRRRPLAVALTVSRVVLALFLGFSAVAKLGAHESAVRSFARMGRGGGAMYVIGGLEMAGAVGLLVPPLAGLAATALVGPGAGAAIVRLTLLEPVNAVMPALLVVLVVLVVLIARDGREGTARLSAPLRRRGRDDAGQWTKR